MDNFRESNKFRFNNDLFLNPINLKELQIYQLGDLFCEHDTIIDNHLQEVQIELSLVERGVGLMVTNGIETKVSAGSVYLSLEGETHSIVSDSIYTLRFFYVAFKILPHSPLYKIYKYLRSNFSSEEKRLFVIPYIFPFVTNMLFEMTYTNEFSNELLESNLTHLIISFYRFLKGTDMSLSNYTIDLKNGVIYNIVNYISKNILEINSLKDVAKKFSYDYIYLSKQFKKVMGITMQNFYIAEKMKHAKHLLINKKKTIVEVAELLNYSSVNNFSRAFKQYYDVPPRTFQKQYDNSDK